MWESSVPSFAKRSAFSLYSCPACALIQQSCTVPSCVRRVRALRARAIVQPVSQTDNQPPKKEGFFKTKQGNNWRELWKTTSCKSHWNFILDIILYFDLPEIAHISRLPSFAEVFVWLPFNLPFSFEFWRVQVLTRWSLQKISTLFFRINSQFVNKLVQNK